MIALLGAMDGEIQEFLRHLEQPVEHELSGFLFQTGTISGHEVVVAKSGVGKTLSAMVTQYLIDRFHPDHIVVTGLAGAINPELEIGDTLVAVDCLQHDMDATPLGFMRGEVPYSGYRVLTCDSALRERAEGCKPDSGQVYSGRILTGDQFLVESGLSSHSYLREELAGDAVEMEGASVGLVAAVHSIPFLIMRTISDKADGRAKIDFGAFLARASLNSWKFVEHILLDPSLK